jgi:hypothetical protein
MDWVNSQGTGFENRVSGRVYTSFIVFALVVATIWSLTVKASLRGGVENVKLSL